MIDALENGELETDLDANHHAILNLFAFLPAPHNLVADDDPRLTDPRLPLDGSVTNISVADDASILQSKLDLNGDIPPTWLGTTSATAAQGDLAEYKVNKGQPNGYAALDGTGKVPPAQLPTDIGSGTITSVGLVAPAEFTVSNSPITTSGTLSVDWTPVADGTWFGNKSGGSGVPVFNTDPIPVSLVPDLPASKITSGTLDPARLPIAVFGAGSKSGAAPDPGDTGDPTDYLARDMTYKPVPTIGPTYQPTMPDPTLTTFSSNDVSTVVGIKSTVVVASLFYKLSVTDPTTYTPVTGTVTVPTTETLSIYGARAGYTNSAIITFVAP